MRIKNLRGECQHCGGRIEFHAESVGTMAECPHCGQQTELLLAAPPEAESSVPTRAIVYTIVAILILGGGLAGALVALKRAQRTAAHKRAALAAANAQPPADPFAQAGFRVSTVSLEKAQGSTLVYAVGTVKNDTTRRRFGVKVELDLLDASAAKIGTATDYQQTLEPKAEWKFKALAVESKAASAKLVSIKEDQ